ASAWECAHDAYFDRFAETMREHVPGDTPEAKATALDRYYHSQCLKDETMAESIVRARESHGPTPLVVHLNGSFHSDFAQGTAARVQRRDPATRTVVITAVPVEDIDAIVPTGVERELARVGVYTRNARKS